MPGVVSRGSSLRWGRTTRLLLLWLAWGSFLLPSRLLWVRVGSRAWRECFGPVARGEVVDPGDVQRRIYANGAARGEFESALLLLEHGTFGSVDQALKYIAESQRVTREVFEMVWDVWDMLETGRLIAGLDGSGLMGPPAA